MIMSKKLSILCYEDHPSNQDVIKFLANNLGASLSIRDTFYRAKTTLCTHLVDEYDVIIVDYMMPHLDADHVLKDLYKLSENKLIIFFSCIEREEFKERCIKILGFKPDRDNFNFIKKAEIGNIKKICKLINTLA